VHHGHFSLSDVFLMTGIEREEYLEQLLEEKQKESEAFSSK
jgi:hypothetical protein